MKTFLLGAALCALSTAASASSIAPAAQPIAGVKNIIILINDGGGYAVYDTTRAYLNHPLVTDGPGFVKTFASTYPLRQDGKTNNMPIIDPVAHSGLVQDPNVVYASSKFWDTTPVAGPSTAAGYSNYPAAFQGYEFSRRAHPDSGSTATALASARKTYNNAINVDGEGIATVTITDTINAAHNAGKSAGVVTAVEFADATPAALGGAHNQFRFNHGDIANEMFSAGKLNVIGGSGNPDYNDDGLPQPAPVYAPAGWVFEPLWTDLKNNTNVSGFNPNHFTLLEDRASIEAIANKAVKPPLHLAMIVKSLNGTQFYRSTAAGPYSTNPANHQSVPYDAATNVNQLEPFATPLKTNVPSQAEMTVAALNVLDQNGRGFYLMTEAGAVDRAEHANDTPRMIEEMIASDQTVQAIIDWVNRKDTAATWGNTLLIVTADHDHLLYGPNGDTVPFQPTQMNPSTAPLPAGAPAGAGHTPLNRWFGPNHGTGIVPVFAYGQGAAAIASLATHVDSYTDGSGHHFGQGLFVDQAELGAVLKATAAQTLAAPKPRH